MFAWTSWKPFPDPRSGAPIEAPIGPGVYEVRRISNGETVAFEHSGNVARSLLSIAMPASRLWFFERPRADAGDLEYRTCAAPSSMDAEALAARMTGQRRLYWRQAVPI